MIEFIRSIIEAVVGESLLDITVHQGGTTDDPTVDLLASGIRIETRIEDAVLSDAIAGRVPQLGGEVAAALDTRLRKFDVAPLCSLRSEAEAQGVAAVLVDQVKWINDVALELRHLLAAFVAHEGVDVDGTERHIAHEMKAHHHHAGDPEEDYVKAGDQHVAGVVALKERVVL